MLVVEDSLGRGLLVFIIGLHGGAGGSQTLKIFYVLTKTCLEDSDPTHNSTHSFVDSWKTDYPLGGFVIACITCATARITSASAPNSE